MSRVFFDEEFQQYRLADNIAGVTEQYELLGTIMGSARPIKAEDSVLTDGIPAETFRFYAESYIDIKETDKIVKDGQEWIIKDVKRYSLKNIERVDCFMTLIKQ